MFKEPLHERRDPIVRGQGEPGLQVDIDDPVAQAVHSAPESGQLGGVHAPEPVLVGQVIILVVHLEQHPAPRKNLKLLIDFHNFKNQILHFAIIAKGDVLDVLESITSDSGGDGKTAGSNDDSVI